MKGSLLYLNKGGVFIGSLLLETIAAHSILRSITFNEDKIFCAI